MSKDGKTFNFIEAVNAEGKTFTIHYKNGIVNMLPVICTEGDLYWIDDGSESDFLIDFTATWNTPGTSMPEPGVISQESEILGIFGDLNQGLCEIPGTNLLGIYATLGAGAELSDTILIKALGIRSIVIRGIYEVI